MVKNIEIDKNSFKYKIDYKNPMGKSHLVSSIHGWVVTG